MSPVDRLRLCALKGFECGERVVWTSQPLGTMRAPATVTKITDTGFVRIRLDTVTPKEPFGQFKLVCPSTLDIA